MCLGENIDIFTAIHSAIGKLEKQAIKVRAKWRDNKRVPRKAAAEEAAGPAGETTGEAEEKKIFRINHHQRSKPMTLEVGLLELEKDRVYLVYRDA